jgi:excisionase family DNA binding protein
VLTPGEAVALLRIEESQLREAAERGELPARQIAAEWRFSRDAVLNWLGVDA